MKKTWLKVKINVLQRVLSPFRRIITIMCFKIIRTSEKWNKNYYDSKIEDLYISVSKKKAFLMKERIIDAGKGSQHVKMLLMKTEQGDMQIILRKQDYPDIYEMTKKSKTDEKREINHILNKISINSYLKKNEARKIIEDCKIEYSDKDSIDKILKLAKSGQSMKIIKLNLS